MPPTLNQRRFAAQCEHTALRGEISRLDVVDGGVGTPKKAVRHLALPPKILDVPNPAEEQDNYKPLTEIIFYGDLAGVGYRVSV